MGDSLTSTKEVDRLLFREPGDVIFGEEVADDSDRELFAFDSPVS